MESFRPMIDYLVMEMDEAQLKQFKLHLQKLFDIKIVINSESHYLSSAIRMYIRRIFRYLNNEPVSLLEIEDFYFEKKEKGE